MPSAVLIVSFCSRHATLTIWKLKILSSVEDANDPKGSVVIFHEDDEEDVIG